MSVMLEDYQDSRPPARSALKVNSKFEILIVKIFSFKKKQQIKYFQKKSSFVSSRKQSHVPSDHNFYFRVNVEESNHAFKLKAAQSKCYIFN